MQELPTSLPSTASESLDHDTCLSRTQRPRQELRWDQCPPAPQGKHLRLRLASWGELHRKDDGSRSTRSHCESFPKLKTKRTAFGEEAKKIKTLIQIAAFALSKL